MISNSISTNWLNSSTPRITLSNQDHRKRYTAPYARGVALCPPLWRRPRAPLARPALLLLARLAGKKKTSSFARPEERAAPGFAEQRGILHPIREMPHALALPRPRRACRKEAGEETSSAASARRPPPGFAERRGMLHLTARVAGGRSCGGLPRSPASAFFLFFRPN